MNMKHSLEATNKFFRSRENYSLIFNHIFEIILLDMVELDEELTDNYFEKLVLDFNFFGK